MFGGFMPQIVGFELFVFRFEKIDCFRNVVFWIISKFRFINYLFQNIFNICFEFVFEIIRTLHEGKSSCCRGNRDRRFQRCRHLDTDLFAYYFLRFGIAHYSAAAIEWLLLNLKISK